MSIIELPAWRLRGQATDGVAVTPGVAASRPLVKIVKPGAAAPARVSYCDRCASPIEFGAVTNGVGTYCSVECSLDGPVRLA